MCSPAKSQAPGVSPLHVPTGGPGVPCQECLLQWPASRVPGHCSSQARQPPKPASHIYLLPCVNVRRMRLSTAGVDGWSMPRHTPHPRVSLLTGPTIQIHTSGSRITIIKIRCITTSRTTTTVPTSPSMLHRLNLPWRFRPKRITFCHTSIMMTPRRTGMTWK